MRTKRGRAAGWTTGAAMTVVVGVTGATTAHATPGTTNVTPPAALLASPSRSNVVRLARGAHPLARPELDEGRVEPGRRLSNLSLFFTMSADQRRDRDALAAAQLDRSSPLFHRWLTPETYRARFGAKAEDVARAASWLTAQGLEVHR